jgi:hypothetical protein
VQLIKDAEMSHTHLAAIAATFLILAGLASNAAAATERIVLEGYRVYDGAPAYFDGKLLTARDLQDEQDYLRSADRLIGESTIPLLERFLRAGSANAILLLDDAEALSSERTEVMDGHDRYDSDFIWLDALSGLWRGRLYLDERGERQAGIYGDLTGTLEGFTPVPLPAMSGPLVLGLLTALSARRARRRDFKLMRTAQLWRGLKTTEND